MNAFFTIAGIVVTILGVMAIAIISGVFIAVKYFGAVLTFGYIKDDKENDTEL